jgi:hypothetical protein
VRSPSAWPALARRSLTRPAAPRSWLVKRRQLHLEPDDLAPGALPASISQGFPAIVAALLSTGYRVEVFTVFSMLSELGFIVRTRPVSQATTAGRTPADAAEQAPEQAPSRGVKRVRCVEPDQSDESRQVPSGRAIATVPPAPDTGTGESEAGARAKAMELVSVVLRRATSQLVSMQPLTRPLGRQWATWMSTCRRANFGARAQAPQHLLSAFAGSALQCVVVVCARTQPSPAAGGHFLRVGILIAHSVGGGAVHMSRHRPTGKSPSWRLM